MERLIVTWRKSSYSGNGGANCVETSGTRGAVLIRDTKDRGNGPVLRITVRDWAQFTRSLKR